MNSMEIIGVNKTLLQLLQCMVSPNNNLDISQVYRYIIPVPIIFSLLYTCNLMSTYERIISIEAKNRFSTDLYRS